MSGTWYLNPLLCIDTETTGVDVFNDRIVEVCAVNVMPDGEPIDAWSTIIDPGIEIPDGAAQIHGISTSRAVAEGVTPVAALTELARRINEHLDTWSITAAPLVMFNAKFDWPLILAEAERHGVEIPPFAGVLDPYLIDRMVDTKRKGKRKLQLVAGHYGIALSDEDAHGAVADAVAAGRVMRALMDRFPKITDHSLATLWLRQVKGHEVDRLGFEDWMRRNVNPDFESIPGWPIPARAG